MKSQKLTQIQILGLKKEPKSVAINGYETTDFSFNKTLNLLTILNINTSITENISVIWNYSVKQILKHPSLKGSHLILSNVYNNSITNNIYNISFSLIIIAFITNFWIYST